MRVEGNAYLLSSCVPDAVLRPSRMTTVCPWTGLANYYDVHVGGQVFPDGAFTFPHPPPVARHIEGRVAFWNAVKA